MIDDVERQAFCQVFIFSLSCAKDVIDHRVEINGSSRRKDFGNRLPNVET